MSLRSLMLAARDELRLPVLSGGLAYTATECDVMGDGRPPPAHGLFFVSLHGGSSQNQAVNCLDELFSFTVTITLALPKVPFDRLGTGLVQIDASGLNARASDVRRVLHMRYNVINVANTALAAAGTGSIYGFTQPLRFESADAPQIVGGNWFNASSKEPYAGMVRNLRFGNARRIQPNNNIQL